MGRRRSKTKQRTKTAAVGEQRGPAAQRLPVGTAGRKVVLKPSWLQGKRPVLRFVVTFGVFMGVFYGLTATAFFEQHGWGPYLDLNASVSGAILRFLGQDVAVSGQSLASPGASLSIRRGCDAIHASALFVSAVLAAPTPMWGKLCGVVVGTALLMLTNLVRIISLFYVRMYYPAAFELMHVEVWQVLFIFLAILLWVVWATWAVRDEVAPPHASA